MTPTNATPQRFPARTAAERQGAEESKRRLWKKATATPGPDEDLFVGMYDADDPDSPIAKAKEDERLANLARAEPRSRWWAFREKTVPRS